MQLQSFGGHLYCNGVPSQQQTLSQVQLSQRGASCLPDIQTAAVCSTSLLLLTLMPVFGCCRTESSKKKPPIYKVMLHNDNYNRREYVVKILLKTVEGLTVDDAVNVMQVGGVVDRIIGYASCVDKYLCAYEVLAAYDSRSTQQATGHRLRPAPSLQQATATAEEHSWCKETMQVAD